MSWFRKFHEIRYFTQCNNLLPLCIRETLVYDLRNGPGSFAQIIEVHIISKKAECVKHADCMAQFALREGTTKFIDVLRQQLQKNN